MTKNTKEALFVKHALSMKKGVLLVGEIANLSHREDVVEFLGVLRRTDAGIFLCVPSPDHEDGIFVERLNTGTLGKVQSAKLDTESSEGGNMPWVKVIGRGSKKVTQQDLSIAEQVERMPGTDRKARRNTSKRGQR